MTGVRSVIVVPHTHWDREWYESEHVFRQRLVSLIDSLIDLMEAEPRFAFLLDGQVALVDDYLRIRPDQRPRLAALIQSGRLQVGPWYVLADELLSTGECLVRNLLLGRSMASDLGSWMAVGYSPDAFGHPAALPTILRGFAIESAVVWRGYGGERGQDHDLFRWLGPDGSTVLTHHLPPNGYEYGAELPNDGAALGDRWRTLETMISGRSATTTGLLLSGADHHAAQPDLLDVISRLRDIVGGVTIRVGSLVDYFQAVADHQPRNTVRGELRFSYRYTWTLQGVHATRSRLKRRIAEGERLLVRWAEPQSALAWSAGGPDPRPLLEDIWRRHLTGCAHDAFGGCTTDEVAADVSRRSHGVVVAARERFVQSVRDRVGLNRVRARRDPAAWRPSLVVINPSPGHRGGVVTATLAYHVDDIPVGRRPNRPGRTPAPDRRRPLVLDAGGAPVPLQVLDRYAAYDRVESPRDYPDADLVDAVRVAIQVRDVEPLSLATLVVTEGEPGGEVSDPVRIDRGNLTTSWGSVGPGRPGAFARSGPGIRPSRGRALVDVESDRDDGDSYTFQPVRGDRPVRAVWGPSATGWVGPLVASLSRPFRVGDRARGRLSVRVEAGSPLVYCAIDGWNDTGQHRLRVIIPHAGPRCETAVADMQFGPVTRVTAPPDVREYPLEWPVASAPMHRYVSITGPGGGLTVFARGGFEYELLPERGLAVTVFRSVEELSRPDLPARPGHAAWPAPTPDAREIGAFRLEFALAFDGVHDGANPSQWDRIERWAETFHAPLAGMMMRYAVDLPAAVPGPALEGAGLAFSTLKPAAHGDAVVLRCVNLTSGPTRGSWRWPVALRRAAKARLDETIEEPLPLYEGDRRVGFEAGPREIVTVLVWPR